MKSNIPLVSRKIQVEGVDPELFHDFKLALFQLNLTIKECLISYIEAFVESARKDAKRARG